VTPRHTHYGRRHTHYGRRDCFSFPTLHLCNVHPMMLARGWRQPPSSDATCQRMEAEGGEERRQEREGRERERRRGREGEGEGEYPTLLVRHDTRGTEFWVLMGHLILGHLFQTGCHSAFTLGVELRKERGRPAFPAAGRFRCCPILLDIIKESRGRWRGRGRRAPSRRRWVLGHGGAGDVACACGVLCRGSSCKGKEGGGR
jgi:hypothetical protein